MRSTEVMLRSSLRCRFFSSTSTPAGKFRIAIIGAGPSGFYCAKYLFLEGKKTENTDVNIDMYDSLPTPFGLVRFGIAPDHPEVRNVENDFRTTMANDNYRFFGNVKLGQDVSLAQLKERYHAVILATGATGERNLNIEGDDLVGVHSAREFVHWYNGHPEFSHLKFDLSHHTAVIIGNGNVAMDVARILVKSPDELALTDIARPALDALRSSQVKQVVVLARRGPSYAAFSRKEFKELTRVADNEVRVDEAAIQRMDEYMETDQDEAQLKKIPVKNKLKSLREFSASLSLGEMGNNVPDPNDNTKKTCDFYFYQVPQRLLAAEGSDDRVGSIVCETKPIATIAAEDTTREVVEVPTGLVFSSIGYRVLPMDGVPYDHDRSVIPSSQGRVVNGPENDSDTGLYVTGWLKRGPTGIIGTNIGDAKETVRSVMEDWSTGALATPDRDLADFSPEGMLLDNKPDLQIVDKEAWDRIDRAETNDHSTSPREKLLTFEELLNVAAGKSNP